MPKVRQGRRQVGYRMKQYGVSGVAAAALSQSAWLNCHLSLCGREAGRQGAAIGTGRLMGGSEWCVRRCCS